MRTVVALAVALAMAGVAQGALIASDNGGNYGSGWTNASNGGSGFGAWSIGTGGAGNNGAFIGDPASGGISGMSATSFGLYANPEGPGNFVNADRDLDAALNIGDIFAFQWGVNWDSDSSGNKGFNLYSGGVSGTQLLNVNIGGFTSTITYDIGGGAQTLFNNYGTAVMNFSFEFLGGVNNQLRVQANGRDGIETFDQTFNLGGSPDAFRLYASDLDSGDNRQPYFNNFTINSIPEPTSLALIGFGVVACTLIRRRK